MLETLCKIGELALLKGISVQSLRIYENYGLIQPVYVDERTGYRYYSQKQFIDTAKIKFLKMVGFSLREIGEFSRIDSLDHSVQKLKKKQKAFEAKVRHMQVLNCEYLRIIEKLDRVTKALNENSELIEIRTVEDFYAFKEDYQYDYKDWLKLEELIFNIQQKDPLFSELGHTYGIMRGYSISALESFHTHLIQHIIFPALPCSRCEDHIEKISLGKCVIAYHTGDGSTLGARLKEISKYVKNNDLQPKSLLYINPIVNAFIISNTEQHIDEIIVPIK